MNHSPAIIVHGGAGSIPEDILAPMLEGCRKAALEGWRVLDAGGSALDAVEQAAIFLEDDPLFNAGTGSTLNLLGEIEMDAAIMDGHTLAVGAVAAVSRIKNPIRLARKVMEDGRHVFLAADGALRFAREAGIPECSPETLLVEARKKHWEKTHGTIGCVAFDRSGAIAAGTSTGGIFDKLPGRIGDSALPGCGTYACETGGVSCTGNGEAIIRTVLAKTAVEFLLGGSGPGEAARKSVAFLEKKTGAKAGLILIDREGRIGYYRNTERMPVCLISGHNEIVTDC
ncbi:MAG: isoaspartyl peptidase/L-asparaginase [Deltaproteobacteria bacterium]|nr:isoaspartyl peptidase/L-asparaginase [Deltaproteobacteria bacterium]